MKKKKSINKKIKLNYSIIAISFFILGVAIMVSASRTAFMDGDAWRKHISKQTRDSILVEPRRGDIYSANDELMATTESRYRMYIDFWADGIVEDTLMYYINPLADGLHKLFPAKSAAQYKEHILKGWKMRKNEETKIKSEIKTNKRSREYALGVGDINYLQLKDLKSLPFFKKGSIKSGLYNRELKIRTNPYGTLAKRTIGDIYKEKNKEGKYGKNGLELYYDSLLSGTPGLAKRKKINGEFLKIIDESPIHGKDIISTIDINIQDITENALLSKLKEIDAESGTAVIMEVATGEVKAISNMGRISEGVWAETKNYAVSDLSEPGSTFKVASMMVALEDGLVHPEDSVDTADGVVMIAGQALKDHNAHKGGYKKITASKSIRYSSNIGVAKLILEAYGNNPSKYVESIYKIGFHKDMNLEIPGYGVPRIPHPKDTTRYWSKTTLPWMSFGYETQIPPIYTLAFFNAIANDGKLLKPRFVKEIRENGKTYEKKEIEVINPAICSPTTLKAIREMLDDVVNQEDGTGKPAKSDLVRIAGKTGTAQISQGASGYKSGGVSYQVSFCGFYPSDNPKYSCIVVIRKPRIGIAGGGSMCGTVFKEIAEKVYARNLIYTENSFPVDTIHSQFPSLKKGGLLQSQTLLDDLEIQYPDSLISERSNADLPDDRVPNVKGMGAKDAIFELENRGLRVNILGKGAVATQSIPPGTKITKGQKISLQLK